MGVLIKLIFLDNSTQFSQTTFETNRYSCKLPWHFWLDSENVMFLWCLLICGILVLTYKFYFQTKTIVAMAIYSFDG